MALPKQTQATAAQEGGFRFPKDDKWRRTPDFVDHTDRLLRHFGFTPEQYAGRTVVDAGAGSTPRTEFFTGARSRRARPWVGDAWAGS